MTSASPGWQYRLLALPLYLLWLLHALKHGHEHGLSRYRAMRMAEPTRDDLTRVWVHAASVGEVRAVSPLVRALLERGESILFTSFTATGYRAIQREFDDAVAASVIPIDCHWHCRRFFDNHDIRLGVVMETELWPELLFQARSRGIELLLVNARLTNKSLRGGRFVRTLLSTTLNLFTQILTRNNSDRDLLLQLGARPDRIEILGNLKAGTAAKSAPVRQLDRDYLLLASSHSGEEEEFLAARPRTLSEWLIVIAPRHTQRSASLRQQIESLGMNYAVRSLEQPVSAQTEVYLADTLGELTDFMAYASVVVMGGSFDDTGGHNLIEPASLGCAIVTGPSDSNIDADIEMLGNGEGVIQVADMESCWEVIASLVEQPERAQALGREARTRLARQPDVLQAYLKAIGRYL